MRNAFIALATLALLSLPAASQDKDKAAVTTTVQHFVDSFNKGDTATAKAVCADQTAIIDEFPPYQWNGTGACAKWMADYDTDAKKNAVTDGVVNLGTPRHVDVTGSRAYVVVPADYAYTEKGKPVKETASTLTIVLTKSAGGWRISAWTWSKS
jgi:ketosteroid isomerase-like protein